MNRNITIVVIILIIVALAAYLVWLRGRYSAAPVVSPQPSVSETPSLAPNPTGEATSSDKLSKEATKAADQKATGSATKKK